MTTLKAFIVALTFFSTPFDWLSTSEVLNGEILVKVSGLKNKQGQLGILVFTDKNGFPSDWQKAYVHVLIPITGAEMEYTFSGLPFGKYAVSVMHDENMNKKHDTNMFGMPKEGYGVSNNIVSSLAPPKFNDAVISIHDEMSIVKINIKY